MIQVAADELGVGVERFTVQHGDTNMLPWSSMTAGSRSGALTGTAVLLSARKVKEKMARIAAHALHVPDARKMVFQDGKVYAENLPGKSLKFEEVADTAYDAESRSRPGWSPPSSSTRPTPLRTTPSRSGPTSPWSRSTGRRGGEAREVLRG